MTIELTALPNGLRIITDYVSAVDSVALGVWVDVGTRDEDLEHNGVAHMVEHMLFKGTKKRNTVEIAESVERVGGHMNAYTSREMTAYYVHLLKEDAPLALDVLADILQNATMPNEEVVRERHVILQEIGMTADTPDDLVFDLYQEIAYPGQAIGAPILGRAPIIASMQRQTMVDYVRRFYTPGRIVVSAAGNIKHDEFVKLVEQHFISLPEGIIKPHQKARYQGGQVLEEKKLEQSHIVMGFEGVSRLDEDYYPALALSTIMGGGMSSRLFQEIREKRGLAYAVFCLHHSYQDTGQFMIYAGTGPDDLPQLMPALCEEINKARGLAMPEELERARAQLKAGLVMSRESMKNRAGQQAKHLIQHGTLFDLQESLTELDAVTLKDMRRAAERIFNAKPSLAALGPLARLEGYDWICTRLAA
jgi:predicted Zn-dependent peptidase